MSANPEHKQQQQQPLLQPVGGEPSAPAASISNSGSGAVAIGMGDGGGAGGGGGGGVEVLPGPGPGSPPTYSEAIAQHYVLIDPTDPRAKKNVVWIPPTRKELTQSTSTSGSYAATVAALFYLSGLFGAIPKEAAIPAGSLVLAYPVLAQFAHAFSWWDANRIKENHIEQTAAAADGRANPYKRAFNMLGFERDKRRTYHILSLVSELIASGLFISTGYMFRQGSAAELSMLGAACALDGTSGVLNYLEMSAYHNRVQGAEKAKPTTKLDTYIPRFGYIGFAGAFVIAVAKDYKDSTLWSTLMYTLATLSGESIRWGFTNSAQAMYLEGVRKASADLNNGINLAALKAQGFSLGGSRPVPCLPKLKIPDDTMAFFRKFLIKGLCLGTGYALGNMPLEKAVLFGGAVLVLALSVHGEKQLQTANKVDAVLHPEDHKEELGLASLALS